MSSYDEAIFRQKLLDRSGGRRVARRSDVHEVFTVVAWDVMEAIRQQRPERLDEADDFIMESIVPGLVALLEEEGWTIEE